MKNFLRKLVEDLKHESKNMFRNVARNCVNLSAALLFVMLGLCAANFLLDSGKTWFARIAVSIFCATAMYYIWKDGERAEKEGRQDSPKYQDSDNALKTGAEVWCIWKKTEIIFYCDGSVTARWRRDRDGNIQGPVYGKTEGYVKSFLLQGKNSRDFSHIHYKDGKIADNSITWFRDNGNKYATVSVESGVYLNGPFEIFYRGGQLKKTGMLMRGLPDGTVKEFYDNGHLKRALRYNSGYRTGNYARYDHNGGIIETGAYEKGRLEGVVKKYFGNGILKNEVIYRNGAALVSTEYYMNGGVKDMVMDEKRVLAGAKTEEMKDLRRLARVHKKLGKYGLEIYEAPYSNFPRLRAVKQAYSGNIIREYSCEEELIKHVLGNETFEKEILERLENIKRGRKTVSYFNNEGKMVTEKVSKL
jgi:antitoxin component YwqK of YwqJK toxin-antitoxin module